MMTYPWMTERRFNAYPDYMKRTFGSRVQKLTIDAGFTCPNRDGSKGTGGCTFCLNDAFNPSYCVPEKSISRQITEGIEFHAQRYRRASKYLAYFQAYSNTHGSIDKLDILFREALGHSAVIGLVIGTRPDCMDKPRLDLLRNISSNHYVVVEYGIESIHNKTLARVNRCHTWEETLAAIQMTAEAGIRVGGHLIFGLPGETREDMMQSASVLSTLPLHSLKFHQLQVFRGTVMENEFLNHPSAFEVFTEAEYLNFMVEFIQYLNPGIVVERIAGETPPRYAVSKPWGPRYDQLLVKFENMLAEKNVWQGKLWDDKEEGKTQPVF